MFPQTVLEVADACSGLRSMMSLLALAVAVAFMTRKVRQAPCADRFSPAIAIATNMFRSSPPVYWRNITVRRQLRVLS